MINLDQKELRGLYYCPKKDGRKLIFGGTKKFVSVVSLGIEEIIWSPSHPDAIEKSAPEKADAYRIIREPRKTLGYGETAIIQYYKIVKNS